MKFRQSKPRLRLWGSPRTAITAEDREYTRRFWQIGETMHGLDAYLAQRPGEAVRDAMCRPADDGLPF